MRCMRATFFSALERNKQKESGMSGSAQKEWLQGVFADDLFNELVPCAADSQALRLCLKPLQQRNASKCLALGRRYPCRQEWRPAQRVCETETGR